MNALAQFLGGLLPILVARRRLHLDRACFFLGWLSWACAASPKIVLLSAIWSVSPYLSKPDTIPHIITIASVELLEVASAYLFLSRHPRLRGVKTGDLSAFALGFGVGEAFTLAISALVPVSFEYYAVLLFVLMVAMERASLVAIQFGWVALLSFYLATRKRIDLVLGVCFKVLTPAISLAIPIVFFMYEISGGASVLYYEVIVVGYAAIILLLTFLRRRKRLDLTSPAVYFDLRYMLAGIIAFTGLALALDMSIPMLYLTGILRWIARFLFFTLATMVMLGLFSWVTREIRLSEVALGGFLGVLIEHLYGLSFVRVDVLEKMTVQSVLFPPASAFLGVLTGIALWRIASR